MTNAAIFCVSVPLYYTNLHLSVRPPWFVCVVSIDVTEVQIFIMVMYLLAAVGGSAFWQALVIHNVHN